MHYDTKQYRLLSVLNKPPARPVHGSPSICVQRRHTGKNWAASAPRAEATLDQTDSDLSRCPEYNIVLVGDDE